MILEYGSELAPYLVYDDQTRALELSLLRFESWALERSGDVGVSRGDDGDFEGGVKGGAADEPGRDTGRRCQSHHVLQWLLQSFPDLVFVLDQERLLLITSQRGDENGWREKGVSIGLACHGGDEAAFPRSSTTQHDLKKLMRKALASMPRASLLLFWRL